MKAKYIWTVLPAGAEQDPTTGIPKLRLSVFVSPRLDPEGEPVTLEMFGDDIGPEGNFTRFVQYLTMSFVFGSGSSAISLPATPVLSEENTLDPELWPRLFPPRTSVRGFRYNINKPMSDKTLISYPIETVHNYLTGLYDTIAKVQPSEFPRVHDVDSGIDELYALLGKFENVRRLLQDTNDGLPSDDSVLGSMELYNTDTDTNINTDAALAYFRAFRFFNRRLHKNEYQEPPFPPDVPQLDFHEQIAALGDYPLLMRKLGLIRDYQVTGPSIQRLSAADVVRAAFPQRDIGDHRFPPTYYRLDTSVPDFQAETESDSELVDGMLDLEPSKGYFVTQVDVDGSALKLIEYAGALLRRRVMRPHWSEGQKESVPALRSAGISIARRNRTEPVTARFLRNDDIVAGFDATDPNKVDNTPLYADDLVRGYRVDIQDQGEWRSLCQRDGNYFIGKGSDRIVIGPLSDEGYVKAASVSGEHDEPDVAYLHEHVFGWSGWSLVASRPGRTLTMDKDENDPRFQRPSFGRVDSAPPDGVELEAVFKVTPKTLPRLRFGGEYLVRARAVDLAGNARPLSTPDAQSHPTDSIVYRRYEPVQQPVLVYQHVLSEGEWLENMVIRSDRGVSVVDYIVSEKVVNKGYLEYSQRHCAPPKTTQSMAETHGAFDSQWEDEDQESHVSTYLLALKEAGTFQDRRIFDPDSESEVLVENIRLVDSASTPPEKLGQWPERRGDSLAAGQYVVHTGERLVLPYLPDPIAMGLTLYDPETNTSWQREWEGEWPFIEPFRIRLREAPDNATEPLVDTDGDTVDIYLPQATIWKLRYSCFIKPDELGNMAQYQAAKQDETARDAAKIGTHWMITPYRELNLVHAVQHPLEDPVATVETDTDRETGQTFARLIGNITCHGRSSSQLDLKAYWIDPVDFVTHDAPTTVFKQAQILSLQPAYHEDEKAFFPSKHRHEFGDTKHRNVVYQAVATTRYREYLPVGLWQNDNSQITASETVLGGPDSVDGDPSLVKDTVSVLSTARPDRPKVLYAVPLFRWEKNSDGTKVSRRGSALRVYLERPWYSSGEGELLGLLLEPSASNISYNDKDACFISQWGSDPLRKNLTPQNRLRSGHFLNAVARAKDLSIPELSDSRRIYLNGGPKKLDLVAFPVRFNTERKLWYTDIELDSGGAYFPFLRLCFARYQPHSIEGVELSSTVRGEFIQLAANRSVAISRRGADQVRISMTGPAGENERGDNTVDTPTAKEIGDLGSAEKVELPSRDIGLVGSPPQPKVERTSMNAVHDNDTLTNLLSKNTEVAARQVVLVGLERRNGNTEFDWEPAGDLIELPAYQELSGSDQVVWWSDMTLTEDAITDPNDHRIVVKEYEVFATDSDVALELSDPTIDVDDPKLDGRRLASRLVFIVYIDVP